MAGPGQALIGLDEFNELRMVIESGELSRDHPDSVVADVERQMTQRIGVDWAIATNSCTSALWLALKTLQLREGDEVIVPGFTYVATLTAVTFAGGTPVLAEIDSTFNLDPDDVAKRITPLTRAIVVVHMLGNPARLDKLMRIASRANIPIIEDCAQAFGATYNGRSVGSFGYASAFSFNEYKTITCGDGGLLAGDDEFVYRYAYALHDQGHEPNDGAQSSAAPWQGLNFRMTELQAAVLRAQLRRLDSIKARLKAARDYIGSFVADVIELRELPDPEGDLATHFVVMFPDAESCRRAADKLGSIPLSESGWHVYSRMRHFDFPLGTLPRTDALLARSMSFGLGIRDANLAPFGLTMHDSVRDMAAKGSLLRTAVEAALK